MSANNIVVIIKEKDGKLRAYHRDMDAWCEGRYDYEGPCPFCGGEGCPLCDDTGFYTPPKETPIFEVDTVEEAIVAYDDWLKEMNNNEDGFPFLVEYGYQFAGRYGDVSPKEVKIDSTKHAGDCSIYASLENIDMPEAGICTCGYGLKCQRKGDHSQLYSKELLEHRGRLTKLNCQILGCNVYIGDPYKQKQIEALLESLRSSAT